MKKIGENMLKGIIALLLSQILIKIIGLIYKLYLTNREGFGDTGNAIYSAGFQIYALLLTFSSTGMPNAIAKLVSERVAIGDNKGGYRIFKIAFYIFAFFGFIGTFLLFLGADVIANKWLEIPEAKYCLITLSPSIFFASITAVLRGYFNGRQNLSITARSQAIEQIFKTVFTIILVELIAHISKNNTVLMASVANMATTAATFFSFSYIYMLYRLRRKEIGQEIMQSVNYKPARIRKTLSKILKESIPISLSSLMSSFNKNIDLFTVVRMLKKFMSEEQAKIQYGILSGKIDMLCLLPLSLNIPFVTAFVPSIAKSMAKGEYRFVNEKITLFLKITILIGLPTTIGLIIFAKPILNLLFPNANDGYFLLQVNSISIIFMILAQTINSILQGIGKVNIPAIAFFIGMICKFFVNILLVGNKNIGIVGAAIGNIICNIIVCLIGIFVIRKNINLKIDYLKIFVKPFICVILMAVCAVIIYNLLKCIFLESLVTIVSIIFAICIYFIFLIIFNIISLSDFLNFFIKKKKIF